MRAQTNQQFPSYQITAGSEAVGTGLGDSAKLCVKGSPQTCYRLKKYAEFAGLAKETYLFYGMPKAVNVSLADGGSLVLFSANSGGGSGTTYGLALLAWKAGKIHDLLPDLLVSNQSDRVLWQLPEISPMPVFATADAIWESGLEAHYGDHHYEISVYRYDEALGKYRLLVRYVTKRKYPGLDISDPRESHYDLLNREKVTVLRLLSKAAR